MLIQPTSKVRKWPWLASLAMHVLFLGWLLYRPAPVFVAPSSVVKGQRPSSSIVYLATANAEAKPTAEALISASVTWPKTFTSSHRIRNVEQKNLRRGPEETRPEQAQNQPSNAGSPFGSLMQGPASGRETRPALPVHFPDPDVNRSELPSGLQGDVIVEITIDAGGNVVETRLLQGVHQTVDQVVIATVQRWRFAPATQDGVPIASKQDVHFHFPS
jgi:TonB family protein